MTTDEARRPNCEYIHVIFWRGEIEAPQEPNAAFTVGESTTENSFEPYIYKRLIHINKERGSFLKKENRIGRG